MLIYNIVVPYKHNNFCTNLDIQRQNLVINKVFIYQTNQYTYHLYNFYLFKRLVVWIRNSLI